MMRTLIAVVACLLPAALWGTAPAAESKDQEQVIVVFQFASADGNQAGRTFSEAMRLRAKRLGFVFVDWLSLKDAMAGAPAPNLDTTAAEMAKILKERLSARFGLWGAVRQEGDGLVMDIRGLDTEKSTTELTINKTYRAAEKQLVNPVEDQILIELTGRAKKPVPEATPEADAKVPTIGPELVKNGGFETGTATPDHWQRIDGQTTFWVGEGHPGKCIKINTDVYHDEWVEWQKKVKAGAVAADAPPPTPTKGAKYDTVAGIYGVAYDSDPIPVTPGKAYKITLDYRGLGTDFFFPKLFIRGWAKVNGEYRVVYDAYLALRSKTQSKEWESNVRIVDIPKETQAPIECLKLKVYAYWPPGVYYFDNVSMKEVDPVAGHKPK
jgi:hypothetical protein